MLENIFNRLNLQEISDIHISSDLPLVVRRCGNLIKEDNIIITHDQMKKYLNYMLKDRVNEFIHNGDIDFRYTYNAINFRCNAYKSNGKYSLCMRIIKNSIPKINEINPNEILYEFTKMKSGLVLITGPCGCGKSTTIASMINEINNSYFKHIITLEDPIEYLYKENKSRINQREIGYDSISYISGIKNCLREDPDVIMIGEMRDKETIKIALRAAQTGHLVFSTLHNDGVVNSIYRIINAFDGIERVEMNTQLASLLRGVIYQRLIPCKNNKERVAAMEIMVCTDGIRNLIREGNFEQINSYIQMGKKYGMQTLDMDLKRLLNNNIISEESYKECTDC